MSNRIHITPCKFESVRDGDITFGVRVFDDYDQVYDNTWESIPDDDLDVFARVLESDDDIIVGILDFVNENRCSIFIGDEEYTAKQYGHLFEE